MFIGWRLIGPYERLCLHTRPERCGHGSSVQGTTLGASSAFSLASQSDRSCHPMASQKDVVALNCVSMAVGGYIRHEPGPHTFRIVDNLHNKYTFTKLKCGSVWKCNKTAAGYPTRPGDVLFLFVVLDYVMVCHGNPELSALKDIQHALDKDRLNYVFRSPWETTHGSVMNEGNHHWESFWGDQLHGEWGGGMIVTTTVLQR